MKNARDKVLGAPRKLRVKWTHECDKDLRAFHTVGAERDLMGGNNAVHGVSKSLDALNQETRSDKKTDDQ